MTEEQNIAMIKETFDAVSESYDNEALRFFSKSAKHLLGCLDLRGDEWVLDVATGTGNAALAIAGSLTTGRVTGVDFSCGMLDQARRRALLMEIDNVEFEEGDMRILRFPADCFDAAVCAFGIFFVGDMHTQLAQIRSVVRSGGQVAITSFREDYFHPLKDMMLDRLVSYGVAKPPEIWKRVSSEAGCRELFEQANLKNIRIEHKNVGYHLHAVDEWWDIIWDAGFRRLVSQLPAETLEQFKREHLQEVDSLKTAQGLWLNVPVLFTTGIK